MAGLRRMQTQKLIQIDNNVQSAVSSALIFLGDFDSFFNTGGKKDDLEMFTVSPTFVPFWKLILMFMLNIF